MRTQSRGGIDSPIFFIDRSLGKVKVASALRLAGIEVKIHDDFFPPDAQDKDWIAEVSRKGWIILTKDKRIRNRAPEFKALVEGKACAFVLTSGNLRGEEMAAIFSKAVKGMARLAARNSRPFIAALTKDGSISALFP